MTITEKIRDLLTRNQIEFRLTSHRAVYTSVEAAEVRGTSLQSGAKALIVKGDEKFVMLVLPADRSVDSKKIRKNLGYRDLRFATAEEVEQMTGLRPGSIPPFGSLFHLKTFCDEGLAENETINFNAGSHTESVSMGYNEWVTVEQPTIKDFTKI